MGPPAPLTEGAQDTLAGLDPRVQGTWLPSAALLRPLSHCGLSFSPESSTFVTGQRRDQRRHYDQAWTTHSKTRGPVLGETASRGKLQKTARGLEPSFLLPPSSEAPLLPGQGYSHLGWGSSDSSDLGHWRAMALALAQIYRTSPGWQ